MRWIGTHGYEIEHIVLGDRPALRVRCRRYRVYHVAYCRTVAELAAVLADAGVGLADLVEVAELPRHGIRPDQPGDCKPIRSHLHSRAEITSSRHTASYVSASTAGSIG